MTDNARLLLADAEATFLEKTAERLRREGYEVDTAGSRAEALARVREGTYDLLLGDVEMPSDQLAAIPLAKPVHFEELLPRIRSAVSRSRTFQAVRDLEERLARWRDEAGQVAAAPDGVDAFLALAMRNVMGSLTDVVTLSRSLRTGEPAARPCQVMNCPRGLQLRAAVQETIEVLEETKSAFKSKTLAALRQKLELLLQHG